MSTLAISVPYFLPFIVYKVFNFPFNLFLLRVTWICIYVCLRACLASLSASSLCISFRISSHILRFSFITDSSLEKTSDAFQKTVHLDAHNVLCFWFWPINMLDNSKYIKKSIHYFNQILHPQHENKLHKTICIATLTSHLYLINDNSSLLTSIYNVLLTSLFVFLSFTFLHSRECK